MKFTFERAGQLAIPLGISASFVSRYLGVMNPSRFEVLYGVGMLLVLVALLLGSQIKKTRKVLKFDLAGQPYESQAKDLSSAPPLLRNALLTCIAVCLVLFWWVATEVTLRLL